MEHAVANTKQAGLGNKAAPQRGSASNAAPELHPALQLQQQVGNQAMQQLLRAGIIQAKLAISQPDDPEEREAEATADRIMRKHAGVTAAPCSCDTDEEDMCDECRQKAADISRKAAGSGPAVSSHRLFDRLGRSAGHPLDSAARTFFEPRFGRDFSRVRIHTDASAAASARSIQAHAFTAGSEIYFAPGQYSPYTDAGRKLLAHELTHTIQKNPDLPAAEATPLAPAHRTGGKDESDSATQDSQAPIEASPSTTIGKISRQDAGADASAPPPSAPSAEAGRDLDAGPSDSGAQPGSEHAEFEGVQLTTDPEEMKARLEGYVEDYGLRDCQLFGERFETDLNRRRYENSPEYLSDVSGVPDWIETNRRTLALIEEAAPIFRTALGQVVQESNEFLAAFDVQAHVTLSQMLSASEERILSEQQRYGLTQSFTQRTRTVRGAGGEPVDRTVQVAHYGMGQNAATRGLATAADNLADKARSVRALMEARDSTQGFTASEYVSDEQSEREMAAYRAADERVQAAVNEYNIMRNAAEGDYPILGAFAPLDTTGTYFVDRTINRLATIAAGSTGQSAESLYDESAERLANINRVYEAVGTGDLSVWSLPSVVGLTMERMNLLPPLMQARLTDDKVEEVQSQSEILQTALAVLAIALGALAAIPTGGSSLAAGVAIAAGIGSAALGIGMAAEHIQRYAIEAAANGTDFDKARAISQNEPSLFWLAVDIIGALGGAAADIHAAATAFQSLSTTLREAAQLRRLAQQGQRVAEAEAKTAQLVREADHVAPGLGDRLARRLATEGASIEREAEIATWEGTLNPQSRAYLVDNPEARAVYEDMNEQLRWLCTHCSDNCLIKGLTRAQTARIEALAHDLSNEQLAALREYLNARKSNINAAIEDLEREAQIRAVHAEEQHPELGTSRRRNSLLSEYEPPNVPEGQRLPRGSEEADSSYGGFWGGERGDSQWFSDVEAVNRITGYRPVPFRNGFPDFRRWAQESVEMTVTGIDNTDFAVADRILAARRGFRNQTAYAEWRSVNRLTWHHVEGGNEMILVPYDLHANVPHVGGASEARAAATSATTGGTSGP